jgi:hypothetical protein
MYMHVPASRVLTLRAYGRASLAALLLRLLLCCRSSLALLLLVDLLVHSAQSLRRGFIGGGSGTRAGDAKSYSGGTPREAAACRSMLDLHLAL